MVGGSAIWQLTFPQDAKGISVQESNLIFDTPFGPTAPFTLASVGGKNFLFVPFHGITSNIPMQTPNSGFERVFYVLWKAGVKKIVGCATAGSYNMLLRPGDIVVESGAVDFTTRRCVSMRRSLAEKGIEFPLFAIRLRQPFCPVLQRIIYEEACSAKGLGRIFDRGITAVMEGPNYDTPEQDEYFAGAGCDVGNQTLFPEVKLAREIGACFGHFQLVSDLTEMVMLRLGIDSIIGDETAIRQKYSAACAEVMAATLRRLDESDVSCGCMKYRKPSTERIPYM